MQKLFSPRPFMRQLTVLSALLFCLCGIHCYGQLAVNGGGFTASQLVHKLAGAGVTTFNPTLTCNDSANGEFLVTGTSNLGLDCGVVLSSGKVSSSGGTTGVNIINGLLAGDAAFNFANTGFGGAGDADLTTLSGLPTHDACILQFDFVPAGSTVSFNYVFGSEEYTSYACTTFNDVFGFLISGPGYATPTNIALVPGTSIPVCINSVNCGATGSGTLSTCTALGAGSPFCAYYVNNSAGTTVTFDGLTTVLTASANVTPCDTFHLKLGVADASDDALDSGVFLEAGSISSIPATTVTAVGIGALPYAIRGCAPGNITFTTSPHCTPTIIKYSITGSAVNGYDYATIADSVIIAPFGTTATVNINPTTGIPPSGPKTVILTVLTPDHCNPDLLVPNPAESATLTIYDSFSLHIITPDTSVCKGDHVQIMVQPDPVFGSIMTYNWVPAAGLSSSTVLDPVTSNTLTTTYTIHGNVTLAAGCPDAVDAITITITPPPALLTDSSYVKTCVGVPVQLHVYATPVGTPYQYSWATSSYLNNNTISNPITTPGIIGDIVYTVTVNPTSDSLCRSTDTVRVHAIGDFVITTPPASVCVGTPVQVIIAGSTEINYNWSPTAGVLTPTSQNPIITPSAIGTVVYTVTGSYAHCPTYVHTFSIAAYQGPTLSTDSPVVKTCVGVPTQLNIHVNPGTVSYDYSWTPAIYLNNYNISNPVSTPLAAGDYTYTVTVNPTALTACKSTDTIHMHVIGDFTINTPDANICVGQSVAVAVTGSNEIHYAWTPTAGVVTATSQSPVITPITKGDFTYVVTGSYANCPDYVHTFHIHADTPNVVYHVTDTICLGMAYTFNVAGPAGFYYHYQWSSVPAAGVTFSNDTLPNPLIIPTNVGAYVFSAISLPLSPACADTSLFNIYVLPNTISVSPTDTSVCAGKVIQVIGTGDVHFAYQWLPTAGIPNSGVLNALITPDTSALYVVTAHFRGCPDIHATLHLDVQPNPTVYIGGNRLLCQFDTLHLSASINPPWYSAYSYTWSPVADLDQSTTRTVVFSGSTTTNLHLVVSTPAGCSSQDSALITVLPGNFASVSGRTEFCPHDTATLTVLPQSGVTYSWYPRLYLDDSASGTPVISPIATQSYTIVATTPNGCKDTVNYMATVFPAAVLYLGDSVILYPGESYHITPSTNCVAFAWFPPEGLSAANISDPVASPVASTKYLVTASTENGCITSDSINIYLSDESLLALPNAFTPGTGANSEFKIIKRGIATLNYFRIFNRWGNLLFETKDIDKGWDGSYSGAPQPFGVYIYEVQAVTTTGRIFNKSGNITIIR